MQLDDSLIIAPHRTHRALLVDSWRRHWNSGRDYWVKRSCLGWSMLVLWRRKTMILIHDLEQFLSLQEEKVLHEAWRNWTEWTERLIARYSDVLLHGWANTWRLNRFSLYQKRWNGLHLKMAAAMMISDLRHRWIIEWLFFIAAQKRLNLASISPSGKLFFREKGILKSWSRLLPSFDWRPSKTESVWFWSRNFYRRSLTHRILLDNDSRPEDGLNHSRSDINTELSGKADEDLFIGIREYRIF